MQSTQEPMECPRCDRKGLVQRNTDVYQCVYCNFRRDLSGSSETADSVFLWIISFAIVMLVMVGIERNREQVKSRQVSSYLLKQMVAIAPSS